MLSRVAERIYWMARYLERAENTARLVNVYRESLLDLPKGVGVQWRQLVEITGTEEYFEPRYRSSGERNVMKFVLGDLDNPSSVLSCLAAARENVRTTRDLIPSEGWEHVNELYLFARKKFAKSKLPLNQHAVLSEIVMRAQQIAGLLAGTMSHGDAYQFARLGRSIERADMTTRILDVGSTTLIAPGEEIERLENRLWMNVLRSLSAYQMYRQYVRRRVSGSDAVEFLLRDEQFPRSVAHNLITIAEALKRLPRSDKPLRVTARTQRHLASTDTAALFGNGLHLYMDELQVAFADINEQVVNAWFLPRLDEAV